ncbi:leucine--tRNA ligase [Candidatus Uhrbacteria bacterium]|nr:leucine--tRNA ligase [Candidatus Uhrbacteria bacterium]
MYDHRKIEKKWQARWEKERTFQAPSDTKREKRYVLDMFPYPSSNGLHVGHPEGYTATDIYSRFLRMKGYAVLHPMGWDAFGLPAENFAIKKGVHPAETTKKNIATFKKQIRSLGLSYDWSKEIDTSAPDYYRWTQWLFLELYKRDLAYKRKAPVNWCSGCQTVLANEQVVEGECERCHTGVIQKDLEQWFLKVTAYADRLLADLASIDWPDSIKRAQEHWIGKSEGAIIDFRLNNSPLKISVFTTRPDTLYGVSYLVLAPEHELIKNLKTPIGNIREVKEYIASTRKKTDMERQRVAQKKSGVPLKGITAIHPATKEEVPVWIADYCLASYGTGAVMGVPAHDDRDLAFAKQFKLPIKIVVMPEKADSVIKRSHKAYTGPGILVSSGEWSGMSSEEAKKKIVAAVKGQQTIQYKLRDWLISRQRYWGAPIPIIYCEACGEQAVPESDLPVLLPTDVDFKPTGESPLARSKSFHTVLCPACGKKARRESDTLDTFMCSSWYYLRYPNPHSGDVPFEQESLRYWLPVDMYVGGAEHAVLHLLYARFITKALEDAEFVPFSEPFTRLRNQGLILGEDGEKMSKSRGNVVNPDDIVDAYGADTLRLYEMFMGPFEDAKPWNTNNIMGVRRFLERVWRLYTEHLKKPAAHPPADACIRVIHKTIKKVTEDIPSFRFNTALAALMVCVNTMTDHVLQKNEAVPTYLQESFILLLAPFAPHIAEELWEYMGHPATLTYEPWPSYDTALLTEDTCTITIQINGTRRDSMTVPVPTEEEDIRAQAIERENVKKWIAGKTIKKTIYVEKRLINFVIH